MARAGRTYVPPPFSPRLPLRALYEPPVAIALIDDFNRADGTLGANWSSPVIVGRGSDDILTNAIRTVGTYTDSYWNTLYEPEQGVFFDVASVTGAVANHDLQAWITAPNTANASYVSLYYDPTTHLLAFQQKLAAGAQTNLPVDQRTALWTLAVGDRYGLSVSATGRMLAWVKRAGQPWRVVLEGQTTVPVPAAGSYIGLSGNTTMRLDNMGGGGVPFDTPPLLATVLDDFNRAGPALGTSSSGGAWNGVIDNTGHTLATINANMLNFAAPFGSATFDVAYQSDQSVYLDCISTPGASHIAVVYAWVTNEGTGTAGWVYGAYFDDVDRFAWGDQVTGAQTERGTTPNGTTLVAGDTWGISIAPTTKRLKLWRIRGGVRQILLTGIATISEPASSKIAVAGSSGLNAFDNLAGGGTPVSGGPTDTPISVGGSISAVGSLKYDESETLSAAITPVGISLVGIGEAIVASISPTGGYLQGIGEGVGGSVTPSGAPKLAIADVLAGATTPSGVALVGISETFGGAVAPTGAAAVGIGEGLTGSITPTGVIVSAATAKLLSGSISPTGQPILGIADGLGGSVNPTGSSFVGIGEAVGGSVAPTGAMRVDIAERLGGAVTPTGAPTLNIGLFLNGSESPAGSLGLGGAGSINVGGTLSPVGGLVVAIGVVFAGTASPTGNVAVDAAVRLVGTISPSGVRFGDIGLGGSGSITPTGTETHSGGANLSVGGSISPTGAYRHTIGILLAGAISPIGDLLGIGAGPYATARALHAAVTAGPRVALRSVGFVTTVPGRIRTRLRGGWRIGG